MTSNLNYNGRQSQIRSGNETPYNDPNSSQPGDMAEGRSALIGKMFFKTKLCGKFRAGSCPYITNCNFAHSMEELRKPPSNWQEIVAVHEDEKRVSSEPREEFQIPSLGSSDFVGNTHRSHRGRHCKKFYTEEGCPYGDACTFLHDEQSKARESVAISLGPVNSGGQGTGNSGGQGTGSSGNVSNLKPSNWKTRICNKWEQTGYCPFGIKCYFAHGLAELNQYTGGIVESEAKGTSAPSDTKQGELLSKASEARVASSLSIPHSDNYNVGTPSQRLNVGQRTAERSHQKWKGPDKISKIYGDWIDDIE